MPREQRQGIYYSRPRSDILIMIEVQYSGPLTPKNSIVAPPITF